jgi:shikimate dehydrogenase
MNENLREDSLASPNDVQRGYVIFGVPEAQARILTCFNTFFEQAGANALFMPSSSQHKLTINSISTELMKPSMFGVAFSRPQSIEECPTLAELNQDAAITQLISAIRKLPDGRLAGALFDSKGLALHLREQGLSFEGQRVLILGAGTQSTAVALAAVQHGASHLDLLDPRQYLAAKLCSKLQGLSSTSIGIEQRISQYDVIVNTWENQGLLQQSLLSSYFQKICSTGWAVDTGLSLHQSSFLKMAKSFGIQTYSGIPSLRSQVRYYLDFFGELNHFD